MVGADINVAADCGTRALHIAASWSRTECLKKVLAMNADINVKIRTSGATPPHIAARRLSKNRLPYAATAPALL
ncbi:ankyrin repeat domain-containing protein [Endozoicomonas sp. ONNA2]|uniref:ankyrin repeat domain-containing protein n=1 Tax=Endozoicomonas sp. ONNA2 TaxID=2828741 RepID=UPI0035A0C510